jgi:hypothetical protein
MIFPTKQVSEAVSAGMCRSANNLAGEEGLEPSHAGIKIRCLYQLGDSPTQVNSREAANQNNPELSIKNWDEFLQ